MFTGQNESCIANSKSHLADRVPGVVDVPPCYLTEVWYFSTFFSFLFLFFVGRALCPRRPLSAGLAK